MTFLATIGDNGAAITMTSLELVEFINSHEGRGDLTHANFMAKVPKVLGGGVIQFQDTYTHLQNGQQYPCYRFPKREACLMAMSYSYDLQAKVFDRMTALEVAAAKPAAPALPQSYIEALECLLEAKKAEQAALEQLDHAVAKIEVDAPKVVYADALLGSGDDFLLGDVCKSLGLPVMKAREAMKEKGVLLKDGSPAAYVVKKGYFKQHMNPYKDKETKADRVSFTTRVTTYGIEFVRRFGVKHLGLSADRQPGGA